VGTPFLFKLKAPHHAIAGFGFFAGFSLLPDWPAWDTFGDANGVDNLDALRGRLRNIQKDARIEHAREDRGDSLRKIKGRTASWDKARTTGFSRPRQHQCRPLDRSSEQPAAGGRRRCDPSATRPSRFSDAAYAGVPPVGVRATPRRGVLAGTRQGRHGPSRQSA
jgi:hypothetical protein